MCLLILIHLLVIFLVIAAGDVGHPVGCARYQSMVRTMPFSNGVSGYQPRSSFDLGGVDTVAAVMAEAVCNVGDQLLADALVLQAVMQLGNDGLDDEDVRRSLWPPTL